MSADRREQLLARVWLFQHLDAPTLRSLCTTGRWVQYSRGARIDYPAIAPAVVHALLDGAARGVRQITEGEPVTVAELHAGDIWGLSMFARDMRRSSVLEVVSERATVATFPAAAIAALFRSDSELVWLLVEYLFGCLERARTRIAQLAALTVDQRTAQVLAEKALQSPDGYVADRHAELAAVVGTNRTGITRCLTVLRKRHLVVHDPCRRGVVVPDVQRLIEEFQLDGAF
jgi:CRP-like cAMP-binding protein